MAYGTVNTDIVSDSSGGRLAPISSVFRNRIINGAMVIDQRNAGASVSIPSTATYTLDRYGTVASQSSKFTVQQNAGSVTPPVGFTNYLGVTSSSAYSVPSNEIFSLYQNIEGFNTADLQWGTANAKTITISFWVRSSLTGTFGGSVANDAFNRSYPYSYTISAANTWEYKTITIAGDTTGTWVGATNGIGLRVYFPIGVGTDYSNTAGAWAASGYISATGATSVVGTNGATFYITGVQLEVGSSATGFEYRQYTTELQLCQRYCPVVIIRDSIHYSGFTYSSSGARVTIPFLVETRVAPTGMTTSATVQFLGPSLASTGTAVFGTADVNHADVAPSGASGFSTSGGTALTTASTAKIIFTGCEL